MCTAYMMDAGNMESGVQLFARLQENSLGNLFKLPLFPEGILANESVEIIGDTKAAQALLLDCVVRAILSKEMDGNEASVILINTEHHFTVPVILGAIQHVTKEYKINNKNLIEESLKRLILLNCYDCNQLKFTFFNIERLLQENESIRIVAIDSLSSYYWMDRAELGLVSYKNYCNTVANALVSNIKNFNVITMYASKNTELASKVKGIKRSFIINIVFISDNAFKVDVYEDSLLQKGSNILLDPFVSFI